MNRMRLGMTLTLLFALFAATRCASALEPVREGQEDSVFRAVFAEGELWALSDAGQLFRIREDSDAPQQELLPQPALDLCLRGGHPAVITCEGNLRQLGAAPP